MSLVDPSGLDGHNMMVWRLLARAAWSSALVVLLGLFCTHQRRLNQLLSHPDECSFFSSSSSSQQTWPLPLSSLNDEKIRSSYHQQQQQQQQRQTDTLSSSSISTNIPLSRRMSPSFQSSWMGNMWIPPAPWKYYSTFEMRQFYGHQRMLWIGDSTARRAALTLYGILNGSTVTNDTSVQEINDSTLINVNRYQRTENCTLWPEENETKYRPDICRPFGTTGPGYLSWLRVNCTKQAEEFLQSELQGQSHWTRHVDVVILAVGLWDVIRPYFCPDDRTISQRLDDLLQVAGQLANQHRITVVWRTCGFEGHHPHSSPSSAPMIRIINDQVMNRIDQMPRPPQLGRADHHDVSFPARCSAGLSYVDWAGAIEARSFSSERIEGDIPAHYGLEPRLVLIQMLTNHLMEQGFFEKAPGLAPPAAIPN